MESAKYGAEAPARRPRPERPAAAEAVDGGAVAPQWKRSPIRMRRRPREAVAGDVSEEEDALRIRRARHGLARRRVLHNVEGDDGGAVADEAAPVTREAACAAADAAFLSLPRQAYEDDGAGLFGDSATRRAAALRRWAPEVAPAKATSD